MRQLAALRPFAAFLLALAMIAVAPAAQAADVAGAKAFMEDFADRGLKLVEDESLSADEREQKAREMIDEGFDLDTIGRYVLGRTWRSLSEEEQTEYNQLYKDYVIATYLGRIVDIGNIRFSVTDAEEVKDGDVMVSSVVNPGEGEPVRVGWRVRNGENGFKIIDVVAEGVSLAVTQRSEFNAVLSSRGYPGLKEAMQKKIAQAENS